MKTYYAFYNCYGACLTKLVTFNHNRAFGPVFRAVDVCKKWKDKEEAIGFMRDVAEYLNNFNDKIQIALVQLGTADRRVVAITDWNGNVIRMDECSTS